MDTEKVQLRIDNIKIQIDILRKEKNGLTKKLKWKEFYKKNYESKIDYTQCDSYKMFGKRVKDLSKEELKEYNKIKTRERRRKHIESRKKEG